MSDRPLGDDWWQAGDGTWHPPETNPGASPGPTGTAPNSPLAKGVVAATQAALFTSAGLGAIAAMAIAAESGNFDADRVRSAIDFTEALGGAGTALGVWSMIAVAGWVLNIVWLYQAYRTVQRLGATETRWSPGWAIGAWLIPFANFILPKLVTNEVDRISHPDAGSDPIGVRWKSVSVLMVGHWWWALTIAGTIVLGLGFAVVAEQIDSFTLVEQTYRAGLQATAAGVALWAAGAGAGGILVGRIGGRLIERPATEVF